MKKVITFLVSLISLGTFAQTGIPTWAKDIAPILYTNCTKCHHTGGAGHVSLMDYTDAFNLASIIEYRTTNKTMPPWPPDRKYQHYADERYLTDRQIALIKSWVDAGAPQGNLTQAPTPPIYTNNPFIASPDLTGKIPTFTVPSNNDLYQCFVIPSGLTQDKFLTGMEVLPGNPSIVHHVLIYQDTTGQARANDLADPQPGYTNFGGIGTSNPILIGGWVPGQQPYFYPNGMGIKLYKNADIVLQIHYPKNSLNQQDSTKINMRLSSNTSTRNIIMQAILNHSNGGNGGLLNGPLVIPANQIKTFTSSFTNTYTKFSTLSVAPHMHLIGTSIKAFGVTPTNDTIPFINIPNWDFQWQGQYAFQRFIPIPLNTKLFAQATYDNTVNNPNNPNKANPQTVVRGESTTDEMMLVYFSFLVAQTGDENIVLDSINYATKDSLTDAQIAASMNVGIEEQSNYIKNLQFYDVYPNPASSKVNASFFLPKSATLDWIVYDNLGKLILKNSSTFGSGFQRLPISIIGWSKGIYVLELVGIDGAKRKEFVIE